MVNVAYFGNIHLGHLFFPSLSGDGRGGEGGGGGGRGGGGRGGGGRGGGGGSRNSNKEHSNFSSFFSLYSFNTLLCFRYFHLRLLRLPFSRSDYKYNYKMAERLNVAFVHSPSF